MLVNPLTGQELDKKTLTPPPAANTLGTANTVFDKKFLEKAVGINGTEEQRQIGAAGMNAPMYDINNPKYKNVL